MMKLSIALSVLMSASLPVLAKGGRPSQHASALPKTWDQAESAIQSAIDGVESAEQGCAEAQRQYDDFADGQGSRSRSELDSARHAKDSACNQVGGAQTSVLEACGRAETFLDSHPGDDNAPHKKWVASTRAKYAQGHQSGHGDPFASKHPHARQRR